MCLVITYFSTWSLALVVDADVLFSVGGFCERTPVQQHEDVGAQGCRLGPHVPEYSAHHAHHLHTG